MSSLSFNSNLSFAIPKLHDDGSNWANYAPRIQKAMGAKGIWRHVEGKAVAPREYAVVNGVPVISDGKTPATEEQIKVRETHIIDYDKRKCLVQHIILSTTSTRLGAKIKDLKTAKEMWDIVKADATTKSTLYLLDAEDQLVSMKLSDNDNPKTHLAELKEHFQLMMQHHDNLIEMGSVLSDSRCLNRTDQHFKQLPWQNKLAPLWAQPIQSIFMLRASQRKCTLARSERASKSRPMVRRAYGPATFKVYGLSAMFQVHWPTGFHISA
jgi:hypothetical protein